MEQDFLDFLSATDRFLLSGHERPDGDCLGSQVAFYHLLVEQGKQVQIVNPDAVTKTHEFLLRHTPIGGYDAAAGLPEFDALVLLDCAELTRLGAMGARVAEQGAPIAVIDHHVGSIDGDGAVNLVDCSASATGVLVYRLYEAMGVSISAAAAEGIFLSIVADTGWFRYSNTTEEVFAIAAKMVERGVEPSQIFDSIHRGKHPESVDLTQSVLSTHAFSLGGKYGYLCMSKSAMAQAGRIDFDPDVVLEPVRSVEGVEVVALFKERFDGTVKLSLRAVGDVDVREIARSFGGGGHVKAAGATLGMALPQAVEAVESKVEAALLAAGSSGQGT